MSDAQQFEVFMAKYQDMVFSTAMRLLANATEAEDVAQEAFLKAYAHFDELRGSSSAGGWLKTVTTNLSLNHLSRYRSRWSFFSELFGRDADDAQEHEFADTVQRTVEQQVDELDRSALLGAALQRLPPAQRVPLVLFYIDGLSYADIAAQLGISLGKVKTDIFRGREALRKKLRVKLGDGCAPNPVS